MRTFYVAAAARIMDAYRVRIDLRQAEIDEIGSRRQIERIERELRLIALKAERAEIFRRTQNREVGSDAARKMMREIDLLEARYAG